MAPPRFIVSDLFWRAKGRISSAYRGDKVLTYIINMNYRVFAQIMDLSQKKDPKIVDQKIVSIHFEWTKPLSRQVA